MVLRDWLSVPQRVPKATTETIATESICIGGSNASKVANVAIVATAIFEETSLISHINRMDYVAINYLKKIHPSIIKGCKLDDILHHACYEDYESLKEIRVLEIFAEALQENGSIRPIFNER